MVADSSFKIVIVDESPIRAAILKEGLRDAGFTSVELIAEMQNLLARSSKNPWLAILITSCIFSIIHLSYYGFLARVCLGIVLGLLYYYSGSLWVSITAHFFNNAFAVTQMYILIRKGRSAKEAMDDTMPFWWGLIALVVIYFLFMLFKKISAAVKKRYTSPEDKALEEKWIA